MNILNIQYNIFSVHAPGPMTFLFILEIFKHIQRRENCAMDTHKPVTQPRDQPCFFFILFNLFPLIFCQLN